MLIREVLNEDFSRDDTKALGYWLPEEDNSVPKLGELRKTRLLLKDIRRIRKMVDAKRADHIKKSAFLRNIYKFVPKKDF